ncbi:hypothetical protein JS518_14235 [Clostridiales bacterium FE2010]|nr:hypothetical protein JS518_14235 [Clostridiales bacterium FE2010]
MAKIDGEKDLVKILKHKHGRISEHHDYEIGENRGVFSRIGKNPIKGGLDTSGSSGSGKDTGGTKKITGESGK